MKKVKERLELKLNFLTLMKKPWHKLVDKIFGKRCKCTNKKREIKTIIECIDCGKVMT